MVLGSMEILNQEKARAKNGGRIGGSDENTEALETAEWPGGAKKESWARYSAGAAIVNSQAKSALGDTYRKAISASLGFSR